MAMSIDKASSHFWEFQNLAGPVCGLVRVCGFGSKSLAELCDGVLTDALLHMEVMLRHIDVRVTDDGIQEVSGSIPLAT